jgi:hypothetical protein
MNIASPVSTPKSKDRKGDAHLVLQFDPTAYRHFLDDCDWPEAQKDAFITDLWKIVVSFVDLGFDRHPIQQALACRKSLDADSDAVIDSPPVSTTFNFRSKELAVAPISAREDS